MEEYDVQLLEEMTVFDEETDAYEWFKPKDLKIELSAHMKSKILRRLLDDEKIVKEGGGNGTKYRVRGSNSDEPGIDDSRINSSRTNSNSRIKSSRTNDETDEPLVDENNRSADGQFGNHSRTSSRTSKTNKSSRINGSRTKHEDKAKQAYEKLDLLGNNGVSIDTYRGLYFLATGKNNKLFSKSILKRELKKALLTPEGIRNVLRALEQYVFV